MLRAGLDGIRRELPLEAPVEEDLVAPDEAELLTRGISLLPATLGEALAAFEQDDVAQQALGAQIAGWLTEVKRQEWRDYQSQVSPWEIARYLPLF